MNKLYSEREIRGFLRQAREEADLTQGILADCIYNHIGAGVCDQSYISAIERGDKPLTNIRVLATWARVTKAYELAEILRYQWDLDPLAAPSIRREMNESVASTALNIEEQFTEAHKALSRLTQAYNHRPFDQPFEATDAHYNDLRSMYDVIWAMKSHLFAWAREMDVDLDVMENSWVQQQLVAGRLERGKERSLV